MKEILMREQNTVLSSSDTVMIKGIDNSAF